MSWGSLLERRPVPGHGANCTCDQESSVRIQLLRFILALVDGSSCTVGQTPNIPSEIMFQKSSSFSSMSEGVEEEQAGNHPLGAGMMAKIVQVLKSEPLQSPYRFSLACCLETYLRSSKSHQCDQLRVIKSGLLEQFIVEVLKYANLNHADKNNASASSSDLLEQSSRSRKGPVSLQVACDLIGEVCKYNSVALEFFDSMLQKNVQELESGGQLEKVDNAYSHLGTVIFANLVDTNVLYRSLVLASSGIPCNHSVLTSISLSRQWNKDEAPLCHNDPTQSLIMAQTELSFMSRVKKFVDDTQVDMLVQMLSEVRLFNITYENLCCINTSLIILLVARRNGKLLQVLQQFFVRSETYQRDEAKAKITLSPKQNFRELLWFWSGYYRHRAKDRNSLFASSHIRFHEWHSLVKLLCMDDGSPYSLLPVSMSLPPSPYKFPPVNPRCSRDNFVHSTTHPPSPSHESEE